MQTARNLDTDPLRPEQMGEILEAVCQCGCKAVLATISAMEAGETVPQTESLTVEQQALVLAELKAIMDVYDGKSCSLDD